MASAAAIFGPFRLKLITCGVFSILQRTHLSLFCLYMIVDIFLPLSLKKLSLWYFWTWVRSCECYCLYLDRCWHLRNLTVGSQALSLKNFFWMFPACASFSFLLQMITLPCPVLFAIEIGMTVEGYSGISKSSWRFDFSLLHLTDLIGSLPFSCLLEVKQGDWDNLAWESTLKMLLLGLCYHTLPVTGTLNSIQKLSIFLTRQMAGWSFPFQESPIPR